MRAGEFMFFKRTLTAIIGLGYFFGLVVLSYFYGHYFVDILILSFAFVALYEMFHAFKIAGYQVYKTPLFVIAATAYPGYYLFEIFKGGTGVLGIFIAALFSAAVALTQSTFSKDRTLSDLFATLAILIYPFLFLSSAFIMSSRYFGAYSIVFAVLLPVATDSFAYWFGSIIKGKKLYP
jgi:CDP-diglyceride synthetase